MKRLQCYLIATAIAVLLTIAPPVQAGKCCDARPLKKAQPTAKASPNQTGDKASKPKQPAKGKPTSKISAKKDVKVAKSSAR